MIIAVDFDGTLQLSDGNPNVNLIRRLLVEQHRGAIIILWTCRQGDRLRQAVDFLMRNGLRPNYINQNAPQSIKALGYDSRKILADIYIDDKSAI